MTKEWFLKFNEYKVDAEIYDSKGITIARIPDFAYEWKYNAHLMLIAPKLLQQLDNVVCLEHLWNYDNVAPALLRNTIDEAQEVLDAMRVIRKL